MRLSKPVIAWVVLLWSVRPVWAQAAFEQLEQQVQRDNARDAAAQPGARPPGQEPGYLGIIADDRQEAGTGISIVEVIAGGPAEKAGLKTGDVITSIDGQPVRTMQDFERALGGASAGKKLVFQITREGRNTPIEVTLGQRPPPGQRRFEQFGPIPGTQGNAAGEARGPTLGVRIASVTPELQQSMNLPMASGALVVSVVEGSPAAQAGIAAGNVILAVDSQRVATPADLSRLISQTKPGREVTISFYNGTATMERKVMLSAPVTAATPPTETTAPPLVAPPLGLGGGNGALLPGQPPGGLLSPPLPGQMAPMAPGIGQPPNETDILQSLERRVEDLERRVRELEKERQQPAGTVQPKSTDQQT